MTFQIDSDNSLNFSNFSTETHMFSGLRMLFIDSQIIRTTNYVTYGIQNFIADVGGLAGLFLGFSLLSLFELIIQLFMFIKRMTEKNKVHENNIQNKLKEREASRMNDVIIEISNFELTKSFKKNPAKVRNQQNISIISAVNKNLQEDERMNFGRNPFEILE